MNSNGTNIKVGTVFVCNWGYDANFSDFYRLVSKSGNMATFSRLHPKVVKEAVHSLDSRNLIATDVVDSSKPIIKRKLKGEYFKPTPTTTALIWDGHPIENYNHH